MANSGTGGSTDGAAVGKAGGNGWAGEGGIGEGVVRQEGGGGRNKCRCFGPGESCVPVQIVNRLQSLATSGIRQKGIVVARGTIGTGFWNTTRQN